MIRAATMLGGLAATAYGGLLLAEHGGWQNFQAALTWLVVGVLLHDAVLAPLTVAVGWLALHVTKPGRLGPWAVGLVLLGPLTLLAVPVLGRYGARGDNLTLLDRPYWAGWTGVVVVVCVGIVAARFVQRRRSPRLPAFEPMVEEGRSDGSGDGRR